MYYNIYTFLQQKAKGKNKVSSSAREISEKTGYDIRSVRRYIKQLVDKGCISIKQNFDNYGGNKTNTYSLLQAPVYTENKNVIYDANRIRIFYCSLVSNRGDETVNGRAFTGYMKNFVTVATFCEEMELNYKTYLIACFYVFNEKWCESKFKRPYPPPYIVASKRNALERYNSFMREFHKKSSLNVIDKDQNELIAQDYYTWVQVGKHTEPEFLEMFIQNESISPLFVASIPNIDQTFKKKIEALYGVSPQDSANTTEIIKQLIGK